MPSRSEFDHWQVMSGDPLDTSSVVGKAVLGMHKRKGLNLEPPSSTSSKCSRELSHSS
jgi:hypothetical protein